MHISLKTHFFNHCFKLYKIICMIIDICLIRDIEIKILRNAYFHIRILIPNNAQLGIYENLNFRRIVFEIDKYPLEHA